MNWLQSTVNWINPRGWIGDKTDIEIVRQVIGEYLRFAKAEYQRHNTGIFNVTVDKVLSDLGSLRGNQVGQIAGGIRVAEVSWDDVTNGMEVLAKEGRGKMPVNAQAYISAISGQATTNQFYDIMRTVQTPTREILSTSKDAVVNTVKLQGAFVEYFPYVLGTIAVIGTGYFLAQARSFKGN